MRSEQTHDWIRSGGIVVASLWGIYTFYWQSVLVPSWAPAHINLGISLTPGEGRGSSPGSREMTLKLTATNPSTRKIYLLANAWQLSAIDRRQGLQPAFLEDANGVLLGKALLQSEKYIIDDQYATLAAGRMFDDDMIHPGETIERSILVRIPDTYSAAEVSLVVPVLTRPPDRHLLDGKRMMWQLNSNEDMVPILCRVVPQPDTSFLESDISCDKPEELSSKELDQRLRKFDSLMRVFSDSDQINLPKP